MRIALFGGTFDPPHIGHVQVIAGLLNSRMFDAVWVVPSGERRDKIAAAKAVERLKMTELLLEEYFASSPEVVLFSGQIDGTLEDSSTIALLDYLRSSYPEHSFTCVIGADLLSELRTWVSAERLLKEHVFGVFARDGAEIEPSLPYARRLDLGGIVPCPVSSSSIRRLLGEGKCVSGLLPRSVLAYIEDQGLYSRAREAEPLNKTVLLGRGRFLELLSIGGWEYTRRIKASGVVALIAVTEERDLLLVEQFRPALGRFVVELPAGLVGDSRAFADEGSLTAARRELEEETGFRASSLKLLACAPPSAGLSSELIDFYLAEGLSRVSLELGDGTEDIVLHECPLNRIKEELSRFEAEGKLIDSKVYSALGFLSLLDP